MTSFSYIARDASETVRTGEFHASDADAAREALRKQGMTVDELHPKDEPAFKAEPKKDNLTAPKWIGKTDASPSVPDSVTGYAPLGDTFRLFAGWLLAWYAAVYLIGNYQRLFDLPWEFDIIDNLFASSILLRIAFGTYTFLLVTTLHRWLGGGLWKGILLLIFGVALFLGFHLNI